MKHVTFLFFLAICCRSIPVPAQTNGNPSLKLFIETEMQRLGIPGAAVAILKDNEVMYQQYAGYASLDHEVPVSGKTVFLLASIDKQIIATCIMQLYEQDKLKLEDPVNKYLDSVPASWGQVQIRHLLTHTSGLLDEPLEYSNNRGYDRYSSADIYSHILKQDIIHPVNEKFLYSDAGYFILQQIFEKASGQYYPDYIKEKIFKPLGMMHTTILDPREIVKGRTVSYYRNAEDKLMINNIRQISVGPHFSDIGTTLEDFIRYEKAIYNNQLLKKESYDIMWTPARVNGGRQVSQLEDEASLFDAAASYGFGWELDSLSGFKAVYHSGFTGTSIFRFPGQGLTVLLLTNLTYRPFFSPNALAKKIAAWYLPKTNSAENFVNEKSLVSPQQVLKELLKEQPASHLFTDSFYQRMMPALKNYRNTIARFGKMQGIGREQMVQRENNIIQTFSVEYERGRLVYEVSSNEDGHITCISIQK